MNLRRRLSLAAALVAGAVMTVGLSGCFGEAPAASVTPSATGFASDEEAYAAAEQTYRDFIEALNLEGEGRVGPKPEEYLTGEALDDERAGDARQEADGRHVEGRSFIAGYESVSRTNKEIRARACEDITATRVVDSAGNDVTSPDRTTRAAYNIVYEVEGTTVLISSIRTFAQC
jgi:hypothetical protein